MTTFAINRPSGLMTGAFSFEALATTRNASRLTARELGRLKAGVSASPTAWVFSDLVELADEHDIDANSDGVFLMANKFLLAFPGHLPAPEVGLDHDGDILFDWAGPNKGMLTVALRKDGRLTYAARMATLDKESGTKVFIDAIPKQVLELAQKITQG